MDSLGGVLQQAPSAISEALIALDFYLDSPREIVIVTPRSRAEAAPLLARLRATFLPNRVLLVVPEGRAAAELTRLVLLLEGKVAAKGQPTAYVCKRGVCDLPTADPSVFEKQIHQVEPLPAVENRAGR